MPGVGTTHHIQLGGHYYLVKPGSYQKRVAPQFGARFTTGDPDFNNLSFWQHWAQRCWVGGLDAPVWADDAMFDEGYGVNTTVHERATLSRSLKRGTGANWAVGGLSETRKFLIYGNQLYCVTWGGSPSYQAAIWKYNGSTDAWALASTLPSGLIAYSVAVWAGGIIIGGTIAGVSGLYWSSGSLASWIQIANPAGVTGIVKSMHSFQQRLYVAFGNQIWRLRTNNTWDGNTVFYTAEISYVVSMEIHLGFLYMLSEDGHILRTDGNSTFDIWQWDGGTVGAAIRSFDGRLFVATYEYTDSSGSIYDEGYGVLYQMSGSAVTQLKRWGKAGEANHLGSLVVHDRRLFYGASNLFGFARGFGIAAYDPVEDAHSLFAVNVDTTTYAPGAAPYLAYMVDDVIFYSNRLWMSVRGHGVFYTPYAYRDEQYGSASYDTTTTTVAPASGGMLVSSTYDAGTPGVLKLWRKISLDYKLPHVSTSLSVDYSTDDGATWLALGTLTGASAGRVRSEFFLENQSSVALKLRVHFRSTNATYSPVLYGFVVSYLPLPEPNWMWTMTLVVSERQALLDGTTATVDTAAELAFLRNAYRTKALLNYVDADGTLWATAGQPGVLVYDISFLLRDLTQPLEGEVLVTLVEAVETY